MDDVFYFNSSVIPLSQLKAIAEEEGYNAEYTSLDDHTNLHISLNETYRCSVLTEKGIIETTRPQYWSVSGWTNYASLTSSELALIESQQILTSYIISYHYPTLNSLFKFVKVILNKFGGWMGLDDDWELIYTKDNIDLIISEQ
jgi:hypothetical protein